MMHSFNSKAGLEFGRQMALGIADAVRDAMNEAEASTFMGLPVIVSEMPEPGQALVVRVRPFGDQTVYMHPTLFHAFKIVRADLSRRVGDPSVMIEASVAWQRERIEKAAQRAVERLDIVMLQQDQRRLQRQQDEELARRLRIAHQGRPHDWHRNVMARTAACRSCGVTITEESAERLGIELPPLLVPPHITQMMVAGLAEQARRNQRWLDLLEQDEVEGVGDAVTFPLRREDGAR